MSDFTYNSFPIPAKPLSGVGETSYLSALLGIAPGGVKKVPTASFLAAAGVYPVALLQCTPQITQVIGDVAANTTLIPLIADTTVSGGDTGVSTGGMSVGDTSPNSGKIVISEAGLYRVSCSIRITRTSSNGGECGAVIKKNGSSVITSVYDEADTDDHFTLTCPTVIASLASGDVLSLNAAIVGGSSDSIYVNGASLLPEDVPTPTSVVLVERLNSASGDSSSTESLAELAAEVQDAREGYDGTTYASLGAAIRGSDEDLDDMIHSLHLAINPDDGLLYLYLGDTPLGEGVDVSGRTRYVVQASLLDTSSNGASWAREADTYQATLTAGTGLTIDSVIVSMGGVDITSTAWNASTSKITVTNVTGDIVLVASAVTTPDTIALTDVDSSYREKTTFVSEEVNEGGLNNFSFVVITDPHSANPSTNKSQNISRYLLKNSKANKLFLLGDYCTTDWNTAAWESFSAPFADCIPKIYLTLGNHEYFSGSSSARADMAATYLTPKEAYLTGNLSSFYYYFDDSVHKVRFIVMNTSDGGTNAFTSAQLTWLNNAVQLPTPDWSIIAMGHFPIYRESDGSEVTSVESVSVERLAIRDALLSTNGTVIAYICGHTHADVRYVVDYSFYEQILTCDMNGTAVTAFDVDLSSKSITGYRIGNRGEDLLFEYDELPEMVTRTITNTLTGCTTNNSATSLINGRPYSATLTADTNYDLSTGTVTVTMGGVDITSTAYTASTRKISIAQVTGNLAITATATYVAPITEFTASWFSKTAAKTGLSFPANMGNVDSEFPNYFAVIYTNASTGTTTGFRSNTYAAYNSRTTGYTQKYWNLIDAAGTTPTGSKVAFTSTNLVEKIINGIRYVYHTFTRADHNAAWAARVAAIAGGQIANSNGGILVYNKTPAAGADIWVIDQEVTADNIDSIAPRLPAHLLKIIATFTQGDHVVYDTDSLDSLKPYLTVQEQWTYNVLEDVAETDYTLSGTLTAGTSTITVTHEGLTATFTVTVTAA